MAFNLDIVGACENIRREASELAGVNYAFNLKKKTGALDFITSPENGSIDNELISYDEGRKIATLKLLYDQRTKACQISTNCNQNVCDPGSTPVRIQKLFEIDDCIKTPVRSYSNDDMVALCMNTQDFIQRRLRSDFVAAHEILDQRVLAEMITQIGINKQFAGSTLPAGSWKQTQLINNALDEQKAPLPGNFAEVMLDYENNELVGQAAVIGQGNLQLFYKLHNWSCCNSSTPYGEADMDGEARFYLSQSANRVLGTNKFILAAFGALHMLTFNENRNIDINDDSVAHIVIPDPLGYPFDWNLDMYWDVCTKSWKVMASLTYGFFNTFQPDSFAADGEDTSPDMSPDCNDDLDGMLGFFGYEATAA